MLHSINHHELGNHLVKLTLTLVLSLLLPASLQADQRPPKIVTDGNLYFRVWQDAVINVTNDGETALRGEVSSSLGLPVRIEWGEFEIGQGADMDINLSLDLDNLLPGTHDGAVIVTSNDYRTGTIFELFTAHVEGEQVLSTLTRNPPLGNVRVGEESTIEIVLVNSSDQPVTITGIDPFLNCFSWAEPRLPFEFDGGDTLTATLAVLQEIPARFKRSSLFVQYERDDLIGSVRIDIPAFNAIPWPEMVFEPSYAAFEAPPEVDRIEWEMIIVNEGNFNYESDVSFSQNHEGFSYLGPDHIRIEPNQEVALPMSWDRPEPNEHGYYAILNFRNNTDPLRRFTMIPMVVIPIEDEPRLEIDGLILDYGQVSLVDNQRETLVISNLSDVGASISLRFISYWFQYGSGFILNEYRYNCDPRSEVVVPFRFYPFWTGSNFEELRIEADFADGESLVLNTLAYADVKINRNPPLPDYSADTLFFELDSGASMEQTFVISNLGEQPFDWEMDLLGEYEWVDFAPPEGNIQPFESSSVTVRVNAIGVSPGLETARLRVVTQVPGHNSRQLVVRASITAPDVVDDNGVLWPVNFSISPPYPNPFNNGTTLNYELPLAGEVNIGVRDMNGRLLHHESLQGDAGLNNIALDAANLPAGIYFVELETAGIVLRTKAVCVK